MPGGRPGRPPGGLAGAAGGARPGLGEHVLAEMLVPGHREMASAAVVVVVVVVATAAQLELGPDVVERPAITRGDRLRRHPDAHVDAPRVAALPVPVIELPALRVRQHAGQVEARSLAARVEAEIKAPAAADAIPEPALELDAETHLE